MASTEVNNVDHRAPDVRHLVYSMYRKMLTGYNDQANEIVDSLPREMVQEDADIYRHLEDVLKQQSSNPSPAGDGSQGVQPPPPPPPSFPGSLPGRRIKTEIPERGLEPPAAIQNAMMTKDKKPFTYTPGGIDLSEIRSPKMQRRINRNACADEMPGIPAPTTNQPGPVSPPTNTHFSAMQSQLPAQVLPPMGGAPPPPPPPPPPGSGSEINSAPPPPAPPVAPSNTQPKPATGRPPLGFDPNELLARVNRTQPYEPPSANNREEPTRNFNIKPQPAEERQNSEPKQQQQNQKQQQQPPKSSEIGQNIYVPLKQNEPGHIYVPHVTPKTQNDTVVTHTPAPATPPSSNAHPTRGQLGSLYVPPVTSVNQEQSTPTPTSPYGYKVTSPTVSSPTSNAETKPQAPWVTVYRTPQSSVPWANREPESPKAGNTRIIPIQIEGRDSPKPTTPVSQPTPPPFLQRQQPQTQQQPFQQQHHQPQQQQQQQQYQQQTQYQQQQQQQQQQQTSNARVIPIQIEGASSNQQPRTQGQNKFNPMTPLSPTPYSPSQEKEHRPQWAPVQPRPFKKEQETNAGQRPQQMNETVRAQQPQPEYGTYNTAGVPLSQLRKMQLSDDDRALMDKFKTQVERHENDIISEENSNPRYRGGYIPSRVFKMLDESVPRSPSRGPAARPVSGGQFQQEAPAGPYVPPSEQQAQEPRKYTGGSIPSRSFRMLQAMTGQEISGSNTSDL